MNLTLQDCIDRFAKRASRGRCELAPLPEDAFDDHPLTRAVIRELRGMVDISDQDIAWIVEATLFQLRRACLSQAVVDLDYLGQVRRHVEIDCDMHGARTIQQAIWDGIAPEEVTLFDQEAPHA